MECWCFWFKRADLDW